MKSVLLSLLALTGTSVAHYTFPELVVNGKGTGNWQYVRQTANYQSNGPVTDVTSNAIRCYPLAPGTSAKTQTVNAGDTVAFNAGSSVSHPGPMQFYMAKVPTGQTAEAWDGSGNVWFKIYQEEAIVKSDSISWASMNKNQIPVTLPKALPSGEYLLRAEHIALHSAGTSGGAQFYISCAQIKVQNGGSGNPSPLVSFPGAYKASDAGILVGIYYPIPTNYKPPGPAVWSG
ncbi:fungal cellulose binding domain-containing protein [Boeremia exigua]|uniref:fungal cellulose binding domain-containing protein n=1 Tax=Boeremia exigua TaxID=749465 RepID=UPI001E8D5A68|nr:fungal cellulose binding domain-containing protein [Boeremia exigua]KAH6620310.1 fungal cellulose binding domain-containing protein [Boeremia exigua]